MTSKYIYFIGWYWWIHFIINAWFVFFYMIQLTLQYPDQLLVCYRYGFDGRYILWKTSLRNSFFFIWNTIFWFIHVLYFLIIWSKWKLKLYLLENWFNFIRSISWYLRTEKTLKKTLTIFVNSINNQFVPSIFLLIFFIVTYIVYNI